MYEDFDPDAPAAPDSGLFGLPHTPEQARVVVLGVPWDPTASRDRGTAGAPAAVLRASHQVDLNDVETGEPWQAGIALAEADPDFATWNEEACKLAAPVLSASGPRSDAHHAACARVDELSALVNQRVEDRVGQWLDTGHIPAVLGGDHSVALGGIAAAASRDRELGVLHIDAHADLRAGFAGFTYSHASIMYHVHRSTSVAHIVQVGLRDLGRREAELIRVSPRITAFSDHELAWELASGEVWLTIAARIVRRLPKNVWVSFDIDGLEPSLCPGTGTPVPGGLSWREATLLLKMLAEDHNIVGFDLCEVGRQPYDALVGARLLYKLAGWSIAKRS